MNSMMGWQIWGWGTRPRSAAHVSPEDLVHYGEDGQVGQQGAYPGWGAWSGGEGQSGLEDSGLKVLQLSHRWTGPSQPVSHPQVSGSPKARGRITTEALDRQPPG